MKRLLLIMLAAGLAACASTPVREIHRIDNLTIVYTDAQAIREACQNNLAMGCYIPATKTIYCQADDVNTFFHEMRHVMTGDFHHARN